MANPYAPAAAIPVADREVDVRAQFITRTYGHLLGALLAFTAIEIFLFTSGIAEGIAQAMMQSWIVVLIAFMVIGWVGSSFAETARSLPMQYLGLGLYVVAEALIFVPILYIADRVAPGTIQSAALVTAAGFSGLTMIAFKTRKDFSFLRPVITFGFVIALVLIVASFLFGFSLGIVFSVAMVGLAGAIILYQTSNIMRTYPEDRYVGAALGLFSGVALMFWYVLQIFLSQSD